MGKKLIFLGADFSQNAIILPNSELFLSMTDSFVVGRGIISNEGIDFRQVENESRACIFALDLSSYFLQGVRNIKINIQSQYECILSVGTSTRIEDTKIYDGNGIEKVWAWPTSWEPSLQAPIGENELLFLNVRNITNTGIPSNTVLTDVISGIELG